MRQTVKDHVTELPEPSILSASTRRDFHLRSDKTMWAVHNITGLEPSILYYRHRRLWQNVQTEGRCIVGNPGLYPVQQGLDVRRDCNCTLRKCRGVSRMRFDDQRSAEPTGEASAQTPTKRERLW